MKHVSSSPIASSSPSRPRGRERNFAQGLLFVVNLLATLTLLCVLLLLYVFPDHQGQLGLTEQTTRMLTLDVISMLLIVAWLQRNLTGPWRVATLGAAFVVLAESWLVGLT